MCGYAAWLCQAVGLSVCVDVSVLEISWSTAICCMWQIIHTAISVVCSHMWLSTPAPHVLPSFYHFPHLFPGGLF